MLNPLELELLMVVVSAGIPTQVLGENSQFLTADPATQAPFSLSFDKWGHKVTQEMPWMEFPSEKVESGTTRGTPWFSIHSFLGNKVSSWILGKCGFTAGEGGRP